MVEETARVKIYDYNGTLVTVTGFRVWIREQEPDLARQFYDSGPEERKAATPKIKRIFEHASNEGRYPCELFPGVKERLEQDGQEGYQRVVFSTVKPDTIDRQLRNFGIDSHINRIVSLDEVLQDESLVGAVKEDPRVYQHLVQRILGIARAKAYTDDTPARAVAARTAGVFENVYLFDPDNKEKAGEGYTLINDIRKAA